MTDSESIVKRLYPDAKLESQWTPRGRIFWVKATGFEGQLTHDAGEAWDEAAKEIRNG